MRKALIALSVASVVAISGAYIPLATPTSASSCDDVQFIFARGSGQDLNELEYRFFKSNITNNINLTLPDLKYSFYELGSRLQNGHQYPAVDLGFISAISTTISGGEAFKFGDSVKEGIAELRAYTSQISSSCPNTKFVLGGYSQGAMVMTKSLPYLDAEKYLYVANFGDPKLYLPEGEGLFPAACRGNNLSPYRVYAPNCRTSAGYLGAEKPYQPASWKGKIGLWCNDKDFVCGAGLNLDEPFKTHIKYGTDGHIQKAADIIGKKLIDFFAKKFGIDTSSAKQNNTHYKNHDVVYLLDTTASMNDLLNAKVDDIRRSAELITQNGGRVALWVYGDLWEVSPTRIIDFTSNIEEFKATLDVDQLPTSDGLDKRESAFSAIMTVMNTQDWRNGANKSIMVITDAPPLSTDRDGVTGIDVIRRSLEIDPVNVYTLGVPNTSLESYEYLAYYTSGENYSSLPENLSTTSFINRPNLSMSLKQYTAHPGDIVTFTISGDTSDYESIEWDLDLDGFFDTMSNEPKMSVMYDINIDSFVQAQVNYKNGLRSSASARVTINNDLPVIPEIMINSVMLEDDSAKIELSHGENTLGAIVSLDEAPIGITYSNSIILSDISANTMLTLTPFSSNGTTGSPVSREIAVIGRGSADEVISTLPPAKNTVSDNPPVSFIEKIRQMTQYIIIRAPNTGKK